MKVDARELMFIKKNAPRGLTRLIADNLELPTIKVINELRILKEDYDEKIIAETRRLLREIKGAVYNPVN